MPSKLFFKISSFAYSKKWLFIACGLLWGSACGPKAPPRIAVPENESRQIVQEVKAYLKTLQVLKSAKGYAKVKLKVKGRGSKFEEAILIELPSSFRFETLDDFGQTRFLIVSDGNELSWKDFSRKEKGSSSLTEEEIQKFIPLASNLSETLGLFMGKLPPRDLTQVSVSKTGDPPQYHLVFPEGEMVWDPAARSIVFFSAKEPGGAKEYRYDAGEFKVRGAAAPSPGRKGVRSSLLIPSRIVLKDFKTKNEVEIHYLDLQINPVISKELFEGSSFSGGKSLDHAE